MGGDPVQYFDEMQGPGGETRLPYRAFEAWLKTVPQELLEQKRQEADTLFRRMGITFLVYFEGGSDERLIPFDILPRILSAVEWTRLEAGAISGSRR